MQYTTELSLIVLTVFFSTAQSHFVEIPSDLRYPCNSYSYYPQPLDESYFPQDVRMKRQQQPGLGARIDGVKKECAADWGIPEDKIPANLLKLKTASPKEKCLMACVLQRLNMMTCDNLVSVRGIEQLANEVGKGNPLVTTVAVALAQKYNNHLASLKITDQCEAAFLINRFIGKEMNERRMSIPY